MTTEIHDLEQQAGYCLDMIQHCADLIKNLTGYTPENSKLVFQIHEKAIFAIPITEDNDNFCMGFFMSWHQHYSRRLKDITAALDALRATAV